MGDEWKNKKEGGILCWLVKAVQLRLEGVLRATTSSVTNPRHLRMAFWGNMDLWVRGNVFCAPLRDGIVLGG